jgi:hypothetical protein
MRTQISVEELFFLPPATVVSVRTPGRPEHFALVTARQTVISASKAHGKVVEEGLLEFAVGAELYAHGRWSNRPWQQTMRIARSQLGQPYRLFDNNCEHFVRYCQGLERKSPQLDFAVGFALVAAVVWISVSVLGASGARPTVRFI